MKFKVPIKNKYLRFVAYAVIFLIAVRLLFFVISFGVGGSFGIRHATQGCMGLTLSYETISKYFPEGEMEIKWLDFRYFVPRKSETGEGMESDCLKSGKWCIPTKYSFITNKSRFCLGQDVWFGE